MVRNWFDVAELYSGSYMMFQLRGDAETVRMMSSSPPASSSGSLVSDSDVPFQGQSSTEIITRLLRIVLFVVREL